MRLPIDRKNKYLIFLYSKCIAFFFILRERKKNTTRPTAQYIHTWTTQNINKQTQLFSIKCLNDDITRHYHWFINIFCWIGKCVGFRYWRHCILLFAFFFKYNGRGRDSWYIIHTICEYMEYILSTASWCFVNLIKLNPICHLVNFNVNDI